MERMSAKQNARNDKTPHVVSYHKPNAKSGDALLWKGRRVMITQPCLIGRAPDNDVVLLDDAEASRRHAMIFRHGDDWWLSDMGSRNGIRVNGMKLSHSRRLRDGDELRIGAHCWQVRVGHGHSPEHAALYCADLGVLISGDMLLPKISTNISVFAVTPMADSLADFLQSIDRYRELPAATLVLPSHGLPFHGIEGRVNALHAHHDERLQLLEEQCTGPRSAAELLMTLFSRDLDTHQTMFAMGEAIAHLNRLEHAGRLLRIEDDSGLIRFVRKPDAAEPAGNTSGH